MSEEIGISTIVVLKVSGKKSGVNKVLKKLPSIFPADRMKMSSIMKNANDDNVHVFVDILLDDKEGGSTTNGTS